LIILKLDFEKVFDKIEHHIILEMLKHKGFTEGWIKWIKGILTSGTSLVFLNGVPGKLFHRRRAMRQGYLLCPLLFVPVASLLQTIINKANIWEF
jgi:hypothetical protein